MYLVRLLDLNIAMNNPCSKCVQNLELFRTLFESISSIFALVLVAGKLAGTFKADWIGMATQSKRSGKWEYKNKLGDTDLVFTEGCAALVCGFPSKFG